MKMPGANLIIKPDELDFIKDAEFFRRKNRISAKIKAALELLQAELETEVKKYDFPPVFAGSRPKISRGENYREMPYMILDFPKVFSRNDIFACRSLFLWGHEFSFTVHLSGIYLQKMQGQILSALPALKGEGFYWCVNSLPFEYGYEPGNYMPIDDLAVVQERGDFIKISRRLDFENAGMLVSYGLETYRKLFSAMSPVCA